MKISEKEGGQIILELSKQELYDIYDSVYVVDQEYKTLDKGMFRVPLERVEVLRKGMRHFLKTLDR